MLVARLSSGTALLGLALVFVVQVVMDKVRKKDADKPEDSEDDEE